jgi:hypothetical protein
VTARFPLRARLALLSKLNAAEKSSRSFKQTIMHRYYGDSLLTAMKLQIHTPIIKKIRPHDLYFENC